MKVLLINTYDNYGGAAIACRRLLEAHLSRGIEVKMLVLHKSKESSEIHQHSSTGWNKLSLVMEKALFYPFEKNRRSRFEFSSGLLGMDVSKNPLVVEADIIHLHWIHMGFLSLSSLKSLAELKKTIIWTLHDKWVLTGGCHSAIGCSKYQTECNQCPLQRGKKIFNFAQFIYQKKITLFPNLQPFLVTCSEKYEEALSQSPLTQEIPHTTIPNPIDTDLFRPMSNTEAKRMLELDPRVKYILFISAEIDQQVKGFNFLVDAFARLNRTGVKLLLVGGDKNNTRLTLNSPYTYLGPIESEADLIPIYNAAYLTVVPSIEDNLPNTVLESLSCGTPVLAFPTGGIPEMVVHLENGFITHEKTAESLSKGFEYLLSKEIDQAQYQSNARNSVLQKYTYELISSRYQALYQRLFSKTDVS